MNILPMALVLVVLTGCATTKPEMSSEDYTKFAKGWIGVSYCNRKGWMAPVTAAMGKHYITGGVQQYTFDGARIDREVYNLENSGFAPTQEDCNSLAMAIQDRSQQIAIHNQNVESNQRATQELINSTKIKNTYCNKIGNQTFCNTY